MKLELTHENKIELRNELQTFVVICNAGFWGKGETLEQALDNCKKQGARKKDKFVAWIGTNDMIFDGHYIEATFSLKIGKVRL